MGEYIDQKYLEWGFIKRYDPQDNQAPVRKEAFEDGYRTGYSIGARTGLMTGIAATLFGGLLLSICLSSCSSDHHRGLEKGVQTPSAEQVEKTK